MANKEEIIAGQLHVWLLANQPFGGTIAEMAYEIGVSDQDLNGALYWLRRPEVVQASGWTVPFQTQGATLHDWRVIDITDASPEGSQAGYDSNIMRRLLHVNMFARDLAQLDVVIATTPGRSPLGRKARSLRRVIDGALALIDA